MVNNKTSNKDMGIIMEKIYHEKLANRGLTQEMLSFLKNSDFEDRIPALLPKDVTVYHKIGNGIGFVHDVGIVEGAKTKYYIGILTSDITKEVEATKTAALISKIVYDFMK
jgi:beta-lactamase class A